MLLKTITVKSNWLNILTRFSLLWDTFIHTYMYLLFFPPYCHTTKCDLPLHNTRNKRAEIIFKRQ